MQYEGQQQKLRQRWMLSAADTVIERLFAGRVDKCSHTIDTEGGGCHSGGQEYV